MRDIKHNAQTTNRNWLNMTQTSVNLNHTQNSCSIIEDFFTEVVDNSEYFITDRKIYSSHYTNYRVQFVSAEFRRVRVAHVACARAARSGRVRCGRDWCAVADRRRAAVSRLLPTRDRAQKCQVNKINHHHNINWSARHLLLEREYVGCYWTSDLRPRPHLDFDRMR